MKAKLYILSILFLSLISCDKDIEKELDVNVQAFAEGAEMVDGTLIVKKSTPVTFQIDGDADFITFFNGEGGHRYDRKDMTQLPAGAISSKLSCTFKTQYGSTAENTFHVYLSTSFAGLSKSDKEQDIATINSTEWKDITEQCKLPKSANDTQYGAKGVSSVEIPLDEYLEAPSLTIAFLYHITDNKIRPRWEVRKMKVVTTDLESGNVSELPAGSIGFSAFHEWADGNNVYTTVTNNTAGRWNLVNILNAGNDFMMGIHPGNANKTPNDPLHKSWLISNPIDLRSYNPDRGEVIKTITSALDTYTHTYAKAGNYKASFIFVNENFQYRKEYVKHIDIKVIE